MDLPKLNLPSTDLKIKLVGESMQVFDQVRKKYFVLTPEEWVRQNFIAYLNIIKGYPLGLMKVEKKLLSNGMLNRADIILYNTTGEPNMIVECKSPEININQQAFNQVSRYNSQLKVNFLVVTNGLKHFCCKINYQYNKIEFLNDIPVYKKFL